MIKLVFDTENALYFVDNKPVGDDFLEFDDDSSADILCVPKSEVCTFIPVFSRFRFKNKKPVFKNSAFFYVDYGNGIYKILTKPQKAALDTMPEVVFSNTYDFGGDKHSLTISGENGKTLFIENSNYFYQTDLSGIDFVKADVLQNPIFVITGKKEDSDFLLIVGFYDDYHELLKLDAGKITYEEDGISVTKNLRDMQKRKVYEKYSFEQNNYVLSERKIFSEQIKTHDDLVPYLFLEAVQAGDSDALKSLVAPELYATPDEYKQFFGNFTEIADETFLPHQSGRVFVIMPDGVNFVCVPFIFCVNNGIIIDMKR